MCDRQHGLWCQIWLLGWRGGSVSFCSMILRVQVLTLPTQNTALGKDGLWWKPAQEAGAQWGNGWCHLWGSALHLGTIIGILQSMVKGTHLVMKATRIHSFVCSCIQPWGCWQLMPDAIYLVQRAHLYLEWRSKAWVWEWGRGGKQCWVPVESLSSLFKTCNWNI